MNQSFNFRVLLLSFLFLLSSSKLSASFLAVKQGQKEVKLDEVMVGGSVAEVEDSESMNLSWMEDCNNGDEECLQRRMISEAHLDYIYTQHHKP
ncbi:Phytosulfokine [Quillaja saponaria]|uniref:Phytosulfokine n=1 Tax=Quillaja saponaria TaxID=32244 RepID=A0AAD7QGL7_QUISA|nr:Phytosulfokine [Quillaja saponaria]